MESEVNSMAAESVNNRTNDKLWMMAIQKLNYVADQPGHKQSTLTRDELGQPILMVNGEIVVIEAVDSGGAVEGS